MRNLLDKLVKAFLLVFSDKGCKTKEKVIAEYALRDINKPIGVSEYKTKIVESLPENFKGSLPTIEELELEFEQDKYIENDSHGA